MAIRITEECLACGTCADECPVGAIQEGDDIFSINADECTECATCVEACPTGAIIEE
ncbi:MAG: 4Fe-4S binding protein [Thermoanaerobacteraceae bacterium]|nr:4Fe-4S binding protein [Thermoanaerobacteraceae bacterium]